MLKFKNYIDRLTPEQKILLLTDGKTFFEDEKLRNLVPFVKVSNLNELNSGDVVYPSYSAVANTWNISLINEMTKDLATRGKINGANLVVVPDVKPKTSIYEDRMTEDPFLSSAFSASCLNAVNQTSVASCLSDVSIEHNDVLFSDVKPNNRILREFLFKPFYNVLANEDCSCIAYSSAPMIGEYSNLNETTVNHILKRELTPNSTLCLKSNFEKPIDCFFDGAVLSLEGSRNYLEKAYNTYIELKRSAEEGEGSFEELDEAIISKRAVSDEKLDEWVDRYFEFAISCNELSKNSSDFEINNRQISKEVAKESIVLLKNNGVLPIKKKEKVVIMGELASFESEQTPGFLEVISEINSSNALQVVGVSRGYDLYQDRSENTLALAEVTVQKADTVIVFLGFGKEREKNISRLHNTKLPANQLALIDRLAMLGKKIIAVISSDYAVDMSFDSDCLGVIWAPNMTTDGAEALYDVLIGKSSPSGRLANSLYNNSDELFSELRMNKEFEKTKIGPYIGYKRYDSLNSVCKYPFGFGLSYTTFAYSDVQIAGSGITFSVKNTGKYESFAVVGAYIGKSKTSIVRPKKELKGFAKVLLKPGESKNVSIKLSAKSFYVFDEVINDWTIEKGIYEVYLASDVSTVIDKRKIEVSGDTIKAVPVKISEYLQTETNVTDGDYVLKPKFGFYSKRKKRVHSIFLSVAIALDFLTLMLWCLGLNAVVPFVLSTIILAVALILPTRTHIISKKKLEKAKMEKRKNDFKQEANQSFDKLFIEEFSEEPKPVVEKEISTNDFIAKTEDYSAYFKKGITLERICNDFTQFASEHGVSCDLQTVRTLVSSLSATRLLVLSSIDLTLLHNLLELFSVFMGSNPFFTQASSIMSTNEMFYSTIAKDGVSQTQPTGVKNAFDFAEKNKHNMCFTVLENVDFANVEQYFSRFMRYVTSPQFESTITLTSAGTEKQLVIPDNMWFIMTASQNECFNAPKYIIEASCVIDLTLSSIYPSTYTISPIVPSIHQFIKLIANAQEQFKIDEDVWKRIDKLESFVKNKTDFVIGNKQWLRMEKFLSVFLNVGGDIKIAQDTLITVKLLLSMLTAISNFDNSLSENVEEDNDFSHVLASVFGEENVDLSQALIKQFKLSKYA